MIDHYRNLSEIMSSSVIGLAFESVISSLTYYSSTIEAGQPFRQLQQHGMPLAVMDDIMRQKDPSLKMAVEAVLEGSPKLALEHIGGNLLESEQLGKDAAKLWLALDGDTRTNTILLAPTHEMRAATLQ
jgi:hypothetical protein